MSPMRHEERYMRRPLLAIPSLTVTICVFGMSTALACAVGGGHEVPPTPHCFGAPATKVTKEVSAGVTTIKGTPGPDVIVGTEGVDVIYGFGGNDKICAGGGGDRVMGGPGEDSIEAGNGDD